MELHRFPAGQLEELSTPITRAAWPEVGYYEEIMDANLWHVVNPTGQLGTIRRHTTAHGREYFEAQTSTSIRDCIRLEDALSFTVLVWAGEWQQVAYGDVNTPLTRVTY